MKGKSIPRYRKGIILAGGTGSRLWPLTECTSKQLLPVFDKPMIYYPLATLMLAGIREVMLISTPDDVPRFRALLGDGSRFGVRIEYAVQGSPRGIAEALLSAANFLGDAASALILGDNLFHGPQLAGRLLQAAHQTSGATIFACPVQDPERYGVVECDANGTALSLVEKPKLPKSRLAVTGLYLYDERAPLIARSLQPSARGELEITDLNRVYLDMGELHTTILSQDSVWFDTGTPESLFAAGEYVRRQQQTRAHHIGCLEEIALLMGWIDRGQLEQSAQRYGKCAYGQHLRALLEDAAA